MIVSRFLFKAAPYLLGAGIAVAGVWYIYNAGQTAGEAASSEFYAEQIQDLRDAHTRQLEGRDEEWQVEVDSLLTQVELYRLRQLRDFEREQELLGRVSSLNISLQEVQRHVYSTDIGVCNLTAEFDRVLDRAFASTTRPDTRTSD